ncbi:hypothetical protein [Streptomyces nogalater]|uniref:Glycosyltransferase n=1 Tax=Streptomyces nogalater TaxID=38314 RepID=A0ABW0WHP3_STRNO
MAAVASAALLWDPGQAPARAAGVVAAAAAAGHTVRVVVTSTAPTAVVLTGLRAEVPRRASSPAGPGPARPGAAV